MPTVARIGGYRFFFFSNEGHKPLHIHVESGDGYAKFWLNPVALERSAGLNAPELTKLRRVIEENAQGFEEKWHEYFGL